MDEIFSLNECPYYLRNSQFNTAEPHYKIYGLDTVSYRCSQIGNSVPNEIKYFPTLQIFKKKSQNLHRLIVLVIFARNTLATSVIFDLYYI